MSIQAKCDFIESKWEFDINIDSRFLVLEIGFKQKKFDNLSFGFRTFIGENLVLEKSYPEQGITYVETDQKYLIAEQLELQPEDEVKIDFFANNSGIEYDDFITFTIPRPEQPYESWIWNDSKREWEAPKPRPTSPISFEESFFIWNEEILDWEEYEYKNNYENESI